MQQYGSCTYDIQAKTLPNKVETTRTLTTLAQGWANPEHLYPSQLTQQQGRAVPENQVFLAHSAGNLDHTHSILAML